MPNRHTIDEDQEICQHCFEGTQGIDHEGGGIQKVGQVIQLTLVPQASDMTVAAMLDTTRAR
jgi:hypothetical protein